MLIGETIFDRPQLGFHRFCILGLGAGRRGNRGEVTDDQEQQAHSEE